MSPRNALACVAGVQRGEGKGRGGNERREVRLGRVVLNEGVML